MKQLLFLCLSALVLAACSDLKKQEQINSIDLLSKSVDSIQKIVLKSEIDSIVYRKTATQDVELRIKQNFYSDTVNLAFGKKMDAYKVMRRKFGPLSRTYNALKIGSADELVTLSKLKNDINSGSGERDKYAEFIQFEMNKVKQLSIILSDYLKEKDTTLKVYHQLHPELLAFSLALIKDKK
ncbi:MAG: hypothetical protein KA521_05895 [Crocinitomicaceae bacterium]|nr:hypothetical protein [Crocinitomicaceae bacterium]